jgi:hypothetical protein
MSVRIFFHLGQKYFHIAQNNVRKAQFLLLQTLKKICPSLGHNRQGGCRILIWFIRDICLCYNLVISIFVFYLSIYLFIYLDFHLFIFSTIISSSIFIIFYMLFVYDRKMLISSTSLLLKLLIKWVISTF